MNKQHILQCLTQAKSTLQDQYGVVKLALFGSVAREQATEMSDIDILVSFGKPATAKQYFALLFYLEDLLQAPIDLITETALRPELKPYIEQDLIYV